MGLKVVGRGDMVEASWEEVEAIGRVAVAWTMVPTVPLVPVVGSVVMTTDSAVEAVPVLEEGEMTESVETEVTVLYVFARVAVIRIGAEGEEAPQAGYGHQLKDEVV